ncbi:hypothetical protein [Desulfotomaculum nigrificans]|nr:hypothetical protein [Desulfotomaculum nigrificans]
MYKAFYSLSREPFAKGLKTAILLFLRLLLKHEPGWIILKR